MFELVLLCSMTITQFDADIATAIAKAIVLSEDTPNPTPSPNKVPRSKCTVCKGTGKVKSGDGIAWVNCYNCVAESAKSCKCKECKCTKGECKDPNCPNKAKSKPRVTTSNCPGGKCSVPQRQSRRLFRRW